MFTLIKKYTLLFGALLCSVAFATDDHILLTEVVVTPTDGEYIEIYNPTGSAIDLTNYYISDDADYALFPGNTGNGPAPAIGDSDFIIQFPPGASIDPGQVIVVALHGQGFIDTYASNADYEVDSTDAVADDMISVMVGGSAGLTNSGENIVLFYWDGMSDLVQDVDMLNVGTPSATNAIASKTGISVDGPDADTDASTYNDDANTMPLQTVDPGFGFSTKRIAFEGWTEAAGGNGLTSDDETSEDITLTWDDSSTAPDPGVIVPLELPVQDVIINEVDADTAGTDTLEFIEIYGAPNLALDGLVVVLFNGSSDTSYLALDLDGYSTDANGFFVIGNALVTNVDLTVPDNTLQNGADAVAIYAGDDTDFPDGTAVTDANLVDALVYDTNDGDDSGLIDVLTPGQAQINEDGMGDKDNHSNSRLPDGGTVLDTSTYTQLTPTPGASNESVIPPTIFINEVDADTAGTDTLEFIELYGDPNQSLDGFILVLYNGSSDTSYLTIDLAGESLGPGGFFVVGNTAVANVDVVVPDNSLQNGADAVALYMDDAVNFPDGTAVTATNLIDALVYDTNDGDDSGLIDILTPGQTQINEDGLGDKDNHSNSRLPNGGTLLDTSTYTQQTPTPGATNVIVSGPSVVINEVDADQSGTDAAEFIELYGDPNQSLDGLVLVLFNGSDDASYAAYDLDGQSLDANGFWVIGNDGVANASMSLPGNSLQNGADAVALFVGDAASFPEDTPVTSDNLIDALVYGTGDADDAGLISVLTPGQAQIDEGGGGNQSAHSNSRLPDGGAALNTTTYVQQDPTPGVSNVPVPVIFINEVDADTAGTDTLEFVELFGEANQSLDGMVLVLYNGSNNASYLAVDLDGQSLDAEGFFVLGNALVANVDMVIPDNSLQNGADAVALYQGNDTDFPADTPVTNENLIDALVYDTNDADDTDLIDVLTPGQPQQNEDGQGNKDGHSNSRYPDGGTLLDTSSYVQQDPTPGTPNFVPPTLSIEEIQGEGESSPFEGLEVNTVGNVVTVVVGNGFFMQTPNGARGASMASSGIFVLSDAVVSVGDQVDVSGEIIEYFGLTEFAGGNTVQVTGSAAVPAPFNLNGYLDGTNNDPLAMERIEGMLATFNGTASGPTDQFGDTPVVAGNDLPFREPGIAYPGVDGLPIWDGNPEIFEVNDNGGAVGALAKRGATVSATGAIGYSFGDFQVNATTLTVDNGPNGLEPTPVRTPAPGEFTIANQNMLRLSQTDGNYNDRLTKFSNLIRNILHSPDVLALQEVGSIGVLVDLAARLNADDPTLNYTGYLLEGTDSIHNGFLVKDTVTVSNTYQIQAGETFELDGSTFTLHDRPPFILEGTVNGVLPIAVMNLHNRSLLELEEPGFSGLFRRTKRLLQATRIAEHIQTMQNTDPNLYLTVLGDFNAFEFTDGYVDVTGIIAGDLDPLPAMHPGTDEVNPDLVNQILKLPADQRYSYVQEGSAQVLDQVLANQNMDDLIIGIQGAHANADYPRDLLDDPGVGSRSSDHDAMIIYFSVPDPTIVAVPGSPLIINGVPGVTYGVYELVDGDWVFLEDVTVGDDGTGQTSFNAEPDTTYGIGGAGGSSPPGSAIAVTVPTLQEWALLIFITMMAMAGLKMRREV